MSEAINAFLLGLPALFSIVNPISGAFIFGSVTEDRSTEERANMARKVAVYSFVVMMVALWAGALVLAFFGVTLAALRVAGGFVVALTAWELLNRPEHREARKQEQALPAAVTEDIALFPMTIPITTGPGTMAVAVALSASRPRDPQMFAFFVIGMSAAAAALALAIWITYRFSDRIARLMGPGGSRTVTRVSAFLLLCIGVQILITGVVDVFEPLLRQH